MEWAVKGLRKEDHVLPALRRLEKRGAYGVYFIFKSMEQGRTFRITVPKYPTRDPNHRILAVQRSRFTHYYFYIRDAVLGPMIVRVASFFPFHATYWLNRHSFIERELERAGVGFHKSDNAFLAVDDVAALQAAADRLSPAVTRPSRRGAHKIPDHHGSICRLPGRVPQRPCGLSAAATPRSAHHHRFGPLSRNQNPRHPDHPAPGGPLHGGATMGGWTAKQIHEAVLTTFQLSPKTYGLNQLRYDLRKLKGHGLLQRDRSRYAYQLTTKGVQIALLFLLFHKRLCGPLANSCFHHQPAPAHRPNSKLEAAYHKADAAIQNIVDLLATA
jgi:hypothetical protein